VARLRPVHPASWWPDALLAAAFAAMTLGLAGGAFLGWDLAVRSFMDEHRPSVLYWLARAGNLLGQGGYLTEICLVIAVLLALRRHSVRPVLPVLAALALTFGTLKPLKDWIDRAAPHAWQLAHPERLGSGGASYPSGHIVNAVVWYGVLVLLLSQWLPSVWRLVIRVVPLATVCVTTIYLGYHWLTDTAAGLFVGLLLDRILRRIPWDDLPVGGLLHRTGWDAPVVEARRPPAARPAGPVTSLKLRP
jgi:membrane-associated phospholipid phosphatase